MCASAESSERDVYDRIRDDAASFKLALERDELAGIAVENGFGDDELEAISALFSYLAKRHHDNAIGTLLRLSRLPQKSPKTFDGFDFSRIQGRDAKALRGLPSLANLYARSNIAFIGPGGVGKTHLAQAYGRECCMRGYKTYYIKASELKDRLQRAVRSETQARVVNGLVKPSCLIIDEVGRCEFDEACTKLLFDVIDKRYEKDGPNTLVLTSNTPVVNWSKFFHGGETLVCALDRVFDRASVFVMSGTTYRGRELETYSVEAVAEVTRTLGC